MLVYRSDDTVCDAAPALTAVLRQADAARSAPSSDAIVELFIDLGRLEAAIVDRLFPNRDGLHPIADALRHASVAAGHALLASAHDDRAGATLALEELVRRLETVRRLEIPREITMRVPEGYAYYALHPETYAVAAARFAADQSPASTVCIGIRSIGTSLSGVVAASLERLGIPAVTYSVRPRGHPFARHLELSADLKQRLLQPPAGCHFLIVDEGPGLSGSSFAAVARSLCDLGIDAERIVLFPSWNADPSTFRSTEARVVWNRHRRYSALAHEADRAVEQIAGASPHEAVDFSGGAWRSHLLADESTWPAVQPQHEVPKVWLPERGSIVRFAGLGAYGRAKLQRAEKLAEAGLGPGPEWLKRGYLSMPFIEGSPCQDADATLLDRMAEHVAFLVRTFPATRSPDVDAMLELVETNVRLDFGPGVSLSDLETFRAPLADAPCAAIDGRMRPHEWVRTGDDARPMFLKTDALDHHADHFFPGLQDAGWDLAAIEFEFRLPAWAIERLLAGYIATSRDRGVAARLPFYRLAYPAFRLGYATLARGSLGGTADGLRFERVMEACRTRLHALVGAQASAVTFPNAP
jgi:hypothetical protein